MIIKRFFLFLVFSLLIGCSNPVDIVKNSTLDIDRSVTIDDVYKSYKYFNKKEWIHFKDSQNRNVIQFSSTINIDKFLVDYKKTHEYKVKKNLFGVRHDEENIDSMTYLIQFKIRKNGKGFDIGYQGIEIILRDGQKIRFQRDNLKEIYRNDPLQIPDFLR